MPTVQFWSLTESTPSRNIDFEEGVGPYILAAQAREQGFHSEVHQASLSGCDANRIARRILSSPPDVLAFSVYSGGVALLETIVRTLQGRIPIVIGGPGATMESERVLCSLPSGSVTTLLVQAEGEAVFPAILRTPPSLWQELREGWRLLPDGRISPGTFCSLKNLDEKPMPDYSVSALRRQCERVAEDPTAPPDDRVAAIRALLYAFVETRRGCRYACEFCSEPSLTVHGVRYVTPQRAADELFHLFDRYGITFFNFADNIAFDNEVWWREFVRLFRRHPFCHLMQFGGYGTPKIFSRGDWRHETLPLLCEAGLSFVTLGVQSGSPRILRSIIHRPADDPENACAMVQSLVSRGVCVKVDFIVGHPTETPSDLAQTLHWVRHLYESGAVVFVRRLGVVPGSGYDRLLHAGTYSLPEQTEVSESLISEILSFHGRKDAFLRRINETCVLPHLHCIDRKRKLLFPKPHLPVALLKEQVRRLGHMPPLLRHRYTSLYHLVLNSRS